ncbi:MAG: hypothetical protein EBZ77_08650 [Chitinophagia bacterium]|nr:hypothetical protein [Chitinophagia bacterium]
MKSKHPLFISGTIALVVALFLVFMDEGAKGWENCCTLQFVDYVFVVIYWAAITAILLFIRFLVLVIGRRAKQ